MLTMFLFVFSQISFADSLPSLRPTAHGNADNISYIPKPPSTNAKSYILIDANSGKIIAEKNADVKRQPASLTKMMTLYVTSEAIQNGSISLNDKVHISVKAWKTGGSKMFIRAGQYVTVADLIKGVIVDSGNDACVALAEHIAGTDSAFAKMMNDTAQKLGMTESHFVDSTGLPRPDHYSTAHDLAILARALIMNFPQDYKWYKEKYFTFNKIKQNNRNRLLWRDKYVDGVKTGHTSEAGYCLVASAKKDGMRLISVVMGTPTDEARAADSQQLLNYGFRFYETHLLYQGGVKLGTQKVYKGKENSVPAAIQYNLYVTIPNGQYKNLKANLQGPKTLKAPINKGQSIGNLVITLNGKTVATRPLIALQADPLGGFFSRVSDSVSSSVGSWFSSKSDNKNSTPIPNKG